MALQCRLLHIGSSAMQHWGGVHTFTRCMLARAAGVLHEIIVGRRGRCIGCVAVGSRDGRTVCHEISMLHVVCSVRCIERVVIE